MTNARFLLTGTSLFSDDMEEAATGWPRPITDNGMGEHVHGHDAQVRFILFVADQSPRSKRARDSINRMFEACGLDPRQVEIVDALTESARVPVHRIVAVPTLMRADGPSHRWLFMAVPDDEGRGRWLDEMLRSGVYSATP